MHNWHSPNCGWFNKRSNIILGPAQGTAPAVGCTSWDTFLDTDDFREVMFSVLQSDARRGIHSWDSRALFLGDYSPPFAGRDQGRVFEQGTLLLLDARHIVYDVGDRVPLPSQGKGQRRVFARGTQRICRGGRCLCVPCGIARYGRRRRRCPSSASLQRQNDLPAFAGEF